MNKKDIREDVSCESCHLKDSLNQKLPAGIVKTGYRFTLLSKTGRKHPVPVMNHAAHFNQKDHISCQVCHAQWTFGDSGKHFLRSDIDDFDPGYRLAIQGNSELEKILINNMDFEKDELPPTMSDKITGVMKAGLWYKGFTKRRWETILIGRDTNNAITTLRPMLDIKLSWVDENEEVRFDSVSPDTDHSGFLPYTPHTTGPAGMFYNERIRVFIENEKKQLNSQLSSQEYQAPK